MTTDPAGDAGFRVSLSNFDGPFDLLLNLITKRELDITEVSLSAVTDEFIGYLAELGPEENLDEASEFLVVAATLLDMKVAGLLPQGEFVDAESVALLEARDLLFARLLQYRAFKEVAVWFSAASRTRAVGTRATCPREKHRAATPELKWTLAPTISLLWRSRLAPSEIPTVGSITCTHRRSIREQAAIVVSLCAQRIRDLPRAGRGRRRAGHHCGPVHLDPRAVPALRLAFEQLEPLGELTIRWVAESWTDEHLQALGADYDN